MKRLLTALMVLLWAGAVFAQSQTTPNRALVLPQAAPGTWGADYNNNFIELDISKIPRVTSANKPQNPELNTVVVVTDAAAGTTCTTGGGTTQNICQWNGSAWVVISGGGGVAGSGHTVYDETTPLTQRTNLRFVGAGVTANDSAGDTVVTIPGGATATTVQNNQSNTYTTGDQNMANASSLTVPSATGAAPTADGRIAFDSTGAITSQRYKVGLGGTTRSIGLVNGDLGTFTGTFNGTAPGYQPLDTELTQLGSATTGANRWPVHNGSSWITSVVPNCNGASDVPKYDNVTFTWSCGTFAGGLTGGTVNVVPMYASVGTPSTLTPTVISQAGGVVTIAATTVQMGSGSCATDCLSDVTPSLTGLGLLTRNRIAVSGDEVVSTGAKTLGQMAVFDAQGRLVQGGAPASAPGADSVTVAMVQSPLKTKSLFIPIGDRVLGSALTDAQDYPIVWRNNVAAMTITEVWCQSDAGTPIINLQRDDGSPANILSSNLTCTTSGATGTIAGAEDNLAVGDKIGFVMVTAGGTAKEVNISIKMTLD